MSLFRAVYSSRPFGYDAGMLNGILTDARRANLRDGITGALICRADIYLQWLEGPEDMVRAAIARIRRDDRHLEVTLHIEEPLAERVFGDWDMLHDPAATWIWTQKEVTDGAIDRATPDEITGFFFKLRDATAAAEGRG
ncbi:BLUF domain-containing protein [Roseicyclus mahoneyensis]|uniref:FAD-dependent sensor of blue light n=1 Tax=Roseicyclus mahoneyensis TaxID=164332 RepID=A0A316GMX5_9RHOB|nr:BLUF domain-containing protein [Roseicyclus mahoneyensis]PWK62520.1 FAD-dependent sensor of blue light [Roseicyclus mahoneyensis]